MVVVVLHCVIPIKPQVCACAHHAHCASRRVSQNFESACCCICAEKRTRPMSARGAIIPVVWMLMHQECRFVACIHHGTVMPSALQLKLGGPLFVTALIIARAKWNSVVCRVGVEPPRVQSVMSFTAYNATRASTAGRKRAAIAAIRICSSLFEAAGVRVPAGVCPDNKGPGCLGKLPAWLGQLAALSAAEALGHLADHVHTVPVNVWSQVEAEYNSAARLCGMAQLNALDLAFRAASLPSPIMPDRVHVATCCVAPAGRLGRRYYYIAAGVGCGIRDLEEVCTAHSCVVHNSQCMCILVLSRCHHHRACAGRLRMCRCMRDR